MRTKRIKIYRFEELSEKAKARAISDYISDGPDTSYIYGEAYETVEAFHKIFGTKEGSRSWFTFSAEDVVNTIKGLRLRKYIINNFWQHLFKGKYYSLWSKNHLKTRYSKVIFDNSGTLTGNCYDNFLLDPIYDFLKKPEDIDFKTLISDCFKALEKAVDKEVMYQSSTEAVTEALTGSDYEFLKDGKQYDL